MHMDVYAHAHIGMAVHVRRCASLTPLTPVFAALFCVCTAGAQVASRLAVILACLYAVLVLVVLVNLLIAIVDEVCLCSH